MDFTRFLEKLVPEQDGPPDLTLRKMTVGAVNANGTLDLISSGVTIPSVPKLDSVAVIVGDRVQVLTGLGTMLVLGPVGAPATRSWTPELGATTTAPTLGTGGSATGSYRREGGLAIVVCRILFGTSGVNAGSGDYRINNLPVTPASMLTPSTAYSQGSAIGDVLLRNGGGTGTSTGAFGQLATPTSAMMMAPGNSGSGGGAVGSSNPWVWVAGSQINATFIYPVAV